MDLYDGIRKALERRGCRWPEEHIFEFMGHRLHFDIQEEGQSYMVKVSHKAAERGDPPDKYQPYIQKDFSLKKAVDKSLLKQTSLKSLYDTLAEGVLFWLESLCATPQLIKVPVEVSSRRESRQYRSSR